MKKYKKLFESSDVLVKFKNYEDIEDEDVLNKELLKHFGFKPDSLNISFNKDKFIGVKGSKQNGKVNAVSIIGGNKADYNNPTQIDETTIKEIAETLLEKNTKQAVIITNCGVDLHNKYPFIKNIKVIKVPTMLKV